MSAHRDLANAQQALNEVVERFVRNYGYMSQHWELRDAFNAYAAERDRLDAPGGSAPRQTSIAAGHVNLHAKESLRRNVILSVVANHAQFGTGMTISELKGRLRKEHSSVSSAISDLAKRGWLRDSGVKRKTQHSCDAIVWEPTEHAITKCREVALEVADGS